MADMAVPPSLEHRPALVADEQVVHVVRVLLLLREDALEQDARGRVLLTEIADQIAVGLDRDPLCDRFSLIMSTRFSPSTYSDAARDRTPSGFRSGRPPS